MGTRLGTALTFLRIGRAAGRSAPGDRLRFWALFGATLAVTFVALASVATLATYDGRESRADARGPVFTEREQAALLYREAGDSVGTRDVWVVFVHPLTDGAPTPAGVTEWPEPGGVLLSPELLRTGAAEGIKTRYGAFAGTIGADGLVTPSERIAYIRVADEPQDPDRWMHVAAFGGGAYSITGEMIDQQSVTAPLSTLWALTGVPALVLVVIAARVGSRSRDRRSGLLQALGGTWRHRMVVNVGEAALPSALGALGAFLPYTVASLWDIRLVPTGYVLDHRDVAAAWHLAAGAAAASLVAVLGMIVGTHRVQRDGRSTRPVSFATTVPIWRLLACGAGVALVLSSQYVPGSAQFAVFCIGTIVMWAFLSSVIALVTRNLGARLAGHGRRSGHPGRLIGGRWTHAHPGVVVRLALAMVIGTGIVAQAQVWTSRFGEEEQAAAITHQRIEDTVIEVTTGGMTAAQTDRFRAALPAGSAVLTLTRHEPDSLKGSSATLTGTCRDLRALRAACAGASSPAGGRTPQVEEIRRWYGDVGFVQAPRIAVKPDSTQLLLVVTPEPGHLSAVKEAAYAFPHLPLQVTTLGELWRGIPNSRLTNWIHLFGATGILFLLVAGAVSAAAEFVRIRHSLAPLAVLTGHRGVFRSVSSWHLTFPLLIATAAAGVMTGWHSVFFVAVSTTGSVSWSLLGAAVAACAGISLAVGAVGARAAAREADRWKPVAD